MAARSFPYGQDDPPEMAKVGFLEKQVFYDTIFGTPYGRIISLVLANHALDGV
jgi:hypothetical protein